MKAVSPPADVVPAATKARVDKHAGHISISFKKTGVTAALP
jgi:hypothetical protein